MRWTSALAAVLVAGCGQVPVGPPRDWAAHPAFVVQPTPAARVWVVSDIHGGFERLVALLVGAHLIDSGHAWTGGADHLYVLGDLIDKAPGGLPTIELLQSLQDQARAAGGEVVVTLGNHEVEFLADPTNDKAAAFIGELKARGLKPFDVASGQGLGQWLRELPVGIKDGDWFLSHSGNSGAESLEALGARIAAQVDKDQFAARVLLGPDSIVEAQQWWASATDSTALVDSHLAALGARHIIFGHDPSAFGKKGAMAQKLTGRLFLVDVGMSPAVNDSTGALLLIERNGVNTVASSVFADGVPNPFFQE